MSNNHHDSSHGSVKSYIVGFILSIILTVIPYYLVVHHAMDFDNLVLTVMAIAVLQLLVQVVYFLHLSFKGEEYSKTLSFIFTILVVLILVIGTIWIMWNLHENMMPGMTH
ncbi:MAG: cytochrome o ubiquinol oxidase subunit IV [Burkholderiales bacterium]|nr:cytochrome o ubiquinol oxidase subunit IV [Burkholderiales bacterium]